MTRRARRTTLLLAALGVVAVATTGCPQAPPPVAPLAPALLIPPLQDAEAGEELRLRRGNEDWIWRVASTTETEVLVDFRIVRGGVPAGPVKQTSWPRNGFGLPPGFVVSEIRRDRIEAAGRTWDCWWLRARSAEGGRSYWITDELPAHGVIRMAVEEKGRPVPATAADVVPEACSRPR
jgi:hypothetical protein